MSASYASGTLGRRQTYVHPAAAHAHSSDGEEFDEPSPSSSMAGSDQSDPEAAETYQRQAPSMLADRLTDWNAPQPVDMTLEGYQKVCQSMLSYIVIP